MPTTAGASIRSVHVEPIGIQLDIDEGESVIHAAWRQNYYWPTVCGGRAECGACVLVVDAGAEHCRPVEPAEAGTLAEVQARRKLVGVARLACRLRVDGPVSVTKKAVRKRITE